MNRGNSRGIRPWPIKDKSSIQVFAMRRKSEGLTPTPAKTSDSKLAIRRRQLLGVIGSSIQIGSDGIRIETGNGFDGRILIWKCAASAAIGTEAREQVGRDGNVASGGQIIRHAARPIAEAKDFVNYQHDRRFFLYLRIDHESLHGAVAVLDGNPFAMTWRFFKFLLRPVLGEAGK